MSLSKATTSGGGSSPWTTSGSDIYYTTGGVSIAATAPTHSSSLDISDGGITMVLGAEGDLTTRTNATSKYAKMACYHYTNAEEPMAMIMGAVTSTNAYVYVGGGAGSCNAATDIQFYAAANNTTSSGTLMATIDSTGLGIGTAVPAATLHTKSSGDGTYPFISSASTGSSQFEIYESATNELAVVGKNTSGAVKWKIATDEASYFTGGNFGIGTNAPACKLNVIGKALVKSNTADTEAVYGYSDVSSNAGTTYGLRATNISIGTGSGYGIKAESSGANATNYGGYFSATNGTSNNYGLVVQAGNSGFGTVAPTQKMHVVGNAIVTGLIRMGLGTEAAPAYQFGEDTNTGIWRPDSDILAISTGGTEKWRVGGSGQVQQPIATPAESSEEYTIDFSESNLQSISVDSDDMAFSGTITLVTTGLAAGRTVKLRIKDTGASGFSVTEPTNWATMGESASVNSGKMAVVELTSWAAGDSDVTAEWSVAPF